MSYTIPTTASDDLARDAEQLHEYLVDQLGYATYDVSVAVTDEGTLEVTVGSGAAVPAVWPTAVVDEYCARSKRERRRLEQHYCRPTRIREELERAIENR